MKSTSLIPLVLLCSSLAGLTGCSQLTPSRAAPPLPQKFTLSLASSTPTSQAWSSFGDAGLSAWIKQVWAENSELSLGLARLDSAAIELRLVRAQQAVGINLEQAVERKKISKLDLGESESSNPSNRYASQFSLGYEIDLRGRLAASLRAGKAEQTASQFDLAALRLSLARQTAELWLSRAELQSNLESTQQTLQLRQQWRQAEQAKFRAGLSNWQTVQEQEYSILSANLLLSKQKEALQSIERSLCLLANAVPSECRLPAAKTLTNLTLPQFGNGLPAQLLQQRPDLAAAQARYDAARARIDEANAARWPSLSIAGVLGVNAASPAGLFKQGASNWSLMPQLSLPILDGGRREAEVEKSQAAAAQQYSQWHAAITRAVHEVENGSAAMLQSTVNYQSLQAQRAIQLQQLNNARAARHAGLAQGQAEWRSQLAVLQIEQDCLAAKREQLLASVNLLAALGGGWQRETGTTP